MNRMKMQKGVGMVEVLVALLVLALGVLGYVALQLRAVDASAEALSKSQAMLIMRGLAEDIRSNPQAFAEYPVRVREYSNYSADTAEPSTCMNTACTAVNMATFDAYQAAKNAHQYGMKITMENCPGVTPAMALRRQCLFIFWGKTEPKRTTVTAEDGTETTTIDASECMQGNGTYVDGASCLMMEAY
ncbi:type IV pilus modification protein PilV [Acinetobacter chinensis]|uniref:Type IV pilus modification protein PilV n=1 Tax=Acinetobacter chinensis TaxID=2004650 RepID=A0ABU3WG01_9GAMM|nr:type IV pilus modification protein PilV [Acinetobacter chinensis]MDV2469344.1 type IV pilus modification protein PilV [Acinetobacter chinensis]